MSKIVFFCIPAYGHTNPTIEVVRELVKGEIRSITIPFMSSGPVLKKQAPSAYPAMILCLPLQKILTKK